jgi:hypothetical protein
VDVHDAVTRSIAEDQTLLDESQLGLSIWTEKEKDLFFSALSRLGRDNVREIASRIGSKSELEVQEYIYLLHHGMMEKSNKLLGITDLPAAIEISEECCGLLERAGDALASRQEQAEEEIEQDKWRDLWLLDLAASKQLEKKLKDEAGRSEVEEVLPAANFFHLRKWLELSSRIFMNPEAEESNWETFAEESEAPSIRATAFEDFHSLAVNVTKRLISATLFCTMSRQRATAAKTIKHAEINQDDVEAAVKILGLKTNSKDFWTGCPRRCNLKVMDEEWNSYMSYEELEKRLSEITESSSSRSMTRHERSLSRAAQSEADPEEATSSPSYSEDYESEKYSFLGHESDYTNSASASDNEPRDQAPENEAPSSKSRRERLLQKAKAKKESERAHEKYIEDFDAEASRGEEQRLWMLLRQTAPFDIKHEPIDLLDLPKGVFRDDMAEQENWRAHVEYRSPWETLDMPVPREKFERNRKRVSMRARKRIERARTRPGSDEEAGGSSDDLDENGNEEQSQAREGLEEGNVQADEGQLYLDHQEEELVCTDSDEEESEAHENTEDNVGGQEDEEQDDGNHNDENELQRESEGVPLSIDDDGGQRGEPRSLISPTSMSEGPVHVQGQVKTCQDSESEYEST